MRLRLLRPLLSLVCGGSLVFAQHASDPVVLRGTDLPSLIGANVDRIVAFRFAGAWTQIPVQVDQRLTCSFGQVLGTGSVLLEGEFYADSQTWTGADPDPFFDADDEICFLARDAGEAAIGGDPPGVRPGTRAGVVLHEPLGGPDRYVYLFVSNGTLAPGAGVDHVSYQFNLLSGSYLTTYQLGVGFNPEDSYVDTAAYRLHFSDRWIHDGLSILAPGASGVEILDRHKFQFLPGSCERTEETFSEDFGAIVANVDGPVRAIRSVIGANSGTLTERLWFFYPDMFKVALIVRVHSIPGIWDYYDYDVATSGMWYHDALNPGGLLIDGAPDAAVLGAGDWHLVTGAHGSLTHVFEVLTNLTLTTSSHYFDDVAPIPPPCTGDASLFGASGPQVPALPWTDPLPSEHNPSGEYGDFQLVRTVFLGGAGATVADAIAHRNEVLTPLDPVPFLTADPDSVSIASGGHQDLSLDLGAAFAGEFFVVLGSLSGTLPGLPLPPLTLPLNLDPYLVKTVTLPNPPLTGSIGVLDLQGRAIVGFDLPPGLATLPSSEIHHSALLVDLATGGLRAVTQSTPLALVP